MIFMPCLKLSLIVLFIQFHSFAFSQEIVKAAAMMDTTFVANTDVLPTFQGGDKKLLEFVSTNIIYPEKAKKKGLVGTSYITFLVKKNGEVANASIDKGIPDCAACDEEALRVVKLMPKWIPGKIDGRDRDVQYILPIKFSLK